MFRAKYRHRFYEANMACGDFSDAAKAYMLADIAAAEMEEVRVFFLFQFLYDYEERAAQSA